MAEGQSSILIVDDDAEDLASVERALRTLGSELVSVKDPHEVMPAVNRLRPDVVILDALLPGLSGFDLCKQIKSDAQLKTTQVLILTGVYLRQQYRHEAIQQFKADAFLTKPFRPPELQRLVVQLLSRKTRTPQSSLLKRIGLPASAEPRKRGFLGRIFGRGEAEEPAPTRIAPVARDIPHPAPAAVAETVAPRAEPEPARAVILEPPKETTPPAPEPTPASIQPETAEVKPASEAAAPAESPAPTPEPEAAPEPAPVVATAVEPARAQEPQQISLPKTMPSEASVAPSEPASAPSTAPEPARAEEPPPAIVPEPKPIDAAPVETPVAAAAPVEQGEKETVPASVNPAPAEASEERAATVPPQETVAPVARVETIEAAPAAEAAGEEPSPTTALDAPPASEAEEVTWIQADSRTQEMTLDEAAARVAEAAQPPAALEDLAADGKETVAEERKEEALPAGDGSQPLRRPLFRVGEVPIYDEPDFLTELKRELSKCKRVDRPLTLILIRVGDLGQIIELFGKDFREPVLWHIAEQAMESLREVDLVGMMSSKDLIAMTAFASDRYGGGRIVTRMRQAVTKKPFHVGEELPPIIPALDFGMASFPADGSEASNLIRRAEEDLRSDQDPAAPSD
ncbi:MAG TPA: response regulator [Vicinamibacteria bacterium]